MTSNELFRGLLAAVSARKPELPGDHDAIHGAFYRVLEEVRKPEVRASLEVEDLIEIDFDPLYGQSGWFDRALTRAQRDQIKLVSRIHPMIGFASVTMTSPEAQS